MKKKYALLSLLSGLFSAVSVHAQNWIELPYKFTNTVFYMSFVDDNHGYVCTEGSYIYKTSDGGSTWTDISPKYQVSPTYSSYSRVCSIDNNTAFAGTYHNNYILKTTDGGNNWDTLSLPQSIKQFTGIYFLNRNTGFAMGPDGVYRTTDSGSNWSQVSSAWFGSSMCFTSPDTGFAGNPLLQQIYRTTDGGLTWNPTGSSNANGDEAIFFFNKQRGIAVGSDAKWTLTNDGGNTWTSYSDPMHSFGDYRNAAFLDDSTGYMVDSDANYGENLKISHDGGKTWTSEIIQCFSGLSDICFPSKNTGYLISAGGDLFKYQSGTNGILSYSRGNDLYVYPNPAGNTINLSTNTSYKNLLVKVQDATGHNVITKEFTEGVSSLQLDLSALSDGVYFINVMMDKTLISPLKFVKTNQ